MRFGTVALVGRTNVGKSTFLNACLGEELAIVSAVPQTTRETLLGVVHRPGVQIALLDTPGLHRPKSELGRRMNARALEATQGADLCVTMTDADPRLEAAATVERDREILGLLPATRASVLVINKVDLLRDKARLLPALVAYAGAHAFRALIPVSLRLRDGVERVLAAIAGELPEAAPAYGSDALTDRSTPYFAREYVREQVLGCTQGEVPHAVAVSVDCIEEHGAVLVVKATVHVEKEGQRRILVGAQGETIKRIGTGARLRLERLFERKVYLELFVRVTPKWKQVPRQLAELGYEAPEDESLLTRLPDAPRRRRSRTG